MLATNNAANAPYNKYKVMLCVPIAIIITKNFESTIIAQITNSSRSS